MTRKHLKRLMFVAASLFGLWLLRACFWYIVQEHQVRSKYSWAIGLTKEQVHGRLKRTQNVIYCDSESTLEWQFPGKRVRYAIDGGPLISFWEGYLRVGFVENSNGRIVDIQVKTFHDMP